MPFEPKNPPPLKQAADAFTAFCKTIAMLRDPDRGCPWDLKQTHASLKGYLIEEAFEVLQAIESGSAAELSEELGDLLLQVVLHAQLAGDSSDFSIVDVISGIDAKMRRRHPHVFNAQGEASSAGAKPLSEQWEAIKSAEKAANRNQESSAQDTEPAAGYFRSRKVHKLMPPSRQALEIGKFAAKIDFDWSNAKEVLNQARSELEELEEALEQAGGQSSAEVLDELSDVYFSLAQVCRHLGVHPEEATDRGNRKFLTRFAEIERLALSAGKAVESAGKAQLEAWWLDAKASGKSGPS